MHACTIIGWTADAALICCDCAERTYPAKFHACGEAATLFDPGWHDCGETGADGSPCRAVAVDGEGNEVHPVFADSDDYGATCDNHDCENTLD